MLDNVLIVFLDKLTDIEGFNKIIEGFDKHKYKMYLYNNIKDTDFDFTELPDIVEYYKKQNKNVNKVVVLSNLRDLTLVWYRCYNSVVDDFIYFVDKEQQNYFDKEDKHYSFYCTLSNFKNIDNEIVEGKVYLNRFDEIYTKYKHEYLEYITHFDYMNKTNKRSIKKKYLFNGYEYLFDLNDSEYQLQKVDVKEIEQDISKNKALKILVYKGQSQYDVLRIMSDNIVNEFRSLGHEVIVIDFLSKDWLNTINEAFTNRIDFVISFNAIGIDLQLNNGDSIYDKFNIPFIGYMVDHPVSLNERIKSKVKNAIFLFCDEENIDYMKSNYPGIKSVFVPLMGFASNNEIIDFKDRKIDILFAGSLINPKEIKDSWQNYDSDLTNILESISDKFLSVPNYALSNIVEYSIRAYKDRLEESDYLKLKEIVYFNIENYVRNYRRYELLNELAKAKLAVHCYTNNIEELNRINIYNTFTIEHSVPFEDLLKVLNSSKIVVNISAQLYSGISERVLSSMANGAVALTDNNNYIDKEFHNGHDILIYDKDQISKVPSIIKDYLNDHKRLEEISFNGMCEAQQNYSPKGFAKKILDIFGRFQSQ